LQRLTYVDIAVTVISVFIAPAPFDVEMCGLARCRQSTALVPPEWINLHPMHLPRPLDSFPLFLHLF
jgi:hypothetical protein